MEDSFVINIIVSMVFAVIVAAIANNRGRSPIAWFFIGFLLSCFGLILVLVLPDQRIEEERRDRLRRDNQRLREQIRKDRQTADNRHAETAGRLGAHDAALGLDTGSTSDGAPPPQLKTKAPRVSAIDPDSRWHYAVNDDSGTEGPVPFSELKDLWAARELTDESLLWTTGMDEWLPLKSLPHVEDELRDA